MVIDNKAKINKTEKAKDKFALFFDIDNTLMINGKISEKDQKALFKVKEQGHLIFINSGRSKAYIPSCVLECADWDGFICGSVYCELHGEIIMKKNISKQGLSEILSFSRENSIPVLFEGVNGVYSVGYGIGKDIAGHEVEFASSDDSEISKVTFLKPLDDYDTSVMKEIRIINFPDYSEGIIKGYNKSTCMELICSRLCIPMSRTAAFGDSANDYEMLAAAGIGVIMACAPTELDKISQIRASSADHGVSEGINKLFF